MKRAALTKGEARARLAKMNLNNDFLFEHVVADEKDGEEFSRLLLKPILGREVGKVRVVPQKSYPGASANLHGSRLDLYVEEYDKDVPAKEPDWEIFDIEPENSE